MKDTSTNLLSIIVGLCTIILGIGLVLLDIFACCSPQNVWISIGCSLISSGVVVAATALIVDKKKPNPLAEWGVSNIYERRSNINDTSSEELGKAKKRLDAIAFGLSSFRSEDGMRIEKYLRKGLNVRILTMHPDSPFVDQRCREEGDVDGQLRNEILQLIQWAKEKNALSKRGKIQIKGYSCMTLDFYWRVDDAMYVGPYWYGKKSQQTITCKLEKNKIGFRRCADYFESLWNDNHLTTLLVSAKD